MIFETLEILKEQLNNYLDESGFGKIVILENVAMLDTSGSGTVDLSNKAIMTLLNLEEESTLKNTPNYVQKTGTKTEYKNPPTNLNLYFLVSANCETYDKSLMCISKVIEFFQGKRTFNSTNTVYKRESLALAELDYFKFILELYTPTFEEMNFVWSTFGGRQLPSVIYKVQLLQIDRKKKIASSKAITGMAEEINRIDQ